MSGSTRERERERETRLGSVLNICRSYLLQNMDSYRVSAGIHKQKLRDVTYILPNSKVHSVLIILTVNAIIVQV